jgi:mannose-6-phosphate isomerase-like protein (cupin superfamily)
MRQIISDKSLTEFFTPEQCFISEVLNDPSFPSFSIAKARVEPGVTTETHKLADTHEVYYIIEGMGVMYIDGNEAKPVGPRDAVYIAANSSQRITNTGTSDLIFLCICTPRFVPESYSAVK